MKNSFIKALLLGIFLSVLIGCSDNHKLDKNLEIVKLPDRLGYSMEQIKFWYEGMTSTYELAKANDTLLTYEGLAVVNEYEFKNNLCTKVITFQSSRENLNMDNTIKDFGFYNVVEKETYVSGGMTKVIKSHKNDSDLLCEYWISELDNGLIGHTIKFYYKE